MLGNIRVWDLRSCKQVIIPDGIERIGNQWFWRADVENVTIPASVWEIGADAFYKCKELKKVIFTGDSRLEKIGSGCFC